MYIGVFNTKLRKCMNVEPVGLNVREGSKPRVCCYCRPSQAHYRTTAQKLLKDLLDQNIFQYCEDSQSD